MTSEVTRIIAYLRARAKVWREAVVPVPRDNLLVADTLDGAANSIESGDSTETCPWCHGIGDGYDLGDRGVQACHECHGTGNRRTAGEEVDTR